MICAEFKNYVERLKTSELFEHQRYIINIIELRCGAPTDMLKVESQNSFNDSDDLILAHLENNNSLPKELPTKEILDKNQLSSPLKLSQNSHVTEAEDSQLDEQSSITLPQPPLKRKLERPVLEMSSIKQPVLKHFDFNLNPISGKAWILEDFLPNREIPTKNRRGRMLEDFNKKINADVNLSSKTEVMSTNFDNLRHRSPSPPGYGRLDFPTTQERAEDKSKSQSIIKEKTLYRFLAATNSKLPPYMREYLFKKSELNDIVDNGKFSWSANKLQVFSR